MEQFLTYASISADLSLAFPSTITSQYKFHNCGQVFGVFIQSCGPFFNTSQYSYSIAFGTSLYNYNAIFGTFLHNYKLIFGVFLYSYSSVFGSFLCICGVVFHTSPSPDHLIKMALHSSSHTTKVLPCRWWTHCVCWTGMTESRAVHASLADNHT